MPADELKSGMHVRQADGDYELVWFKWNIEKTQEMYNFTVDTAHTYFVGEGQWLVHNACKPFEVGMTDDLYAKSEVGDGLQIHHAPQQVPANEVIPGYDGSSAPGIALPDQMHYDVNRFNLQQGEFTGTASELLNKTLNDLAAVGVPKKPLSELRKLILKTYPIMQME